MTERFNINEVYKAEQDFSQRLAVLLTKGFGTMAALYILIAWMFVWMILASLGVWLFANDKYPFAFLLFCSNLIQLWALPVLAVGQNVLHRKAELQADAQFADIEHILARLDTQEKLIEAIHAKVVGDDNGSQ